MKRNDIERLLPTVFRRTIGRDNPLVAILEVMSALHEPSESVLERIDSIYNPFRTPDGFVPFLACWLDLERIFDESLTLKPETGSGRLPISTGITALRALIATAS